MLIMSKTAFYNFKMLGKRYYKRKCKWGRKYQLVVDKNNRWSKLFAEAKSK